MPARLRHVFLDFDGTLVRVESLILLAEVVGRRLEEGPRAELAEAIASLTEQAMAGELSFEQALSERVRRLAPTRADIDEVRALLSREIEPGAPEAIAALDAAGLTVCVLSGGLRDLVLPVSMEAGVDATRVFCNDLVFHGDAAHDVDRDNPLSRDYGKAAVVRSIALPDETAMVGDGVTDLEVKQLGAARIFVAHVGFQRRESVVAGADHVVTSLTELVPLLT